MTHALHDRFWPRGLPRKLHLPRTSLCYKLEVAATRYPDQPAVVFYDTVISYAQLRDRVDAVGIEAWCRTQMSACKVPRVVEFVDALPRASTGKIAWRDLQEREAALRAQ